MINFKININNTEINSNEIIKYIKNCQSKEAISYIMEISGCDLSEATEVVNEIKKTIHDQSIRGAGIRTNHSSEFKKCPKCGKEYMSSMNHCIQCGYKTEKYVRRMNSLKDTIDKEQKSQQNLPHCPVCNSTNIEKISIGKKAKGSFLFGLLSSDVRKQMHCKDCGYKF